MSDHRVWVLSSQKHVEISDLLYKIPLETQYLTLIELVSCLQSLKSQLPSHVFFYGKCQEAAFALSSLYESSGEDSVFIFCSTLDELKKQIIFYFSPKDSSPAEEIRKISPVFGKRLIFNNLLYQFTYNNHTVQLTPKEYRILLFLAENRHFIKREHVIQHIWGEISVSAKSLDVHLHNLRQKIETVGIFIESTKDRTLSLIVKSSKDSTPSIPDLNHLTA